MRTPSSLPLHPAKGQPRALHWGETEAGLAPSSRGAEPPPDPTPPLHPQPLHDAPITAASPEGAAPIAPPAPQRAPSPAACAAPAPPGPPNSPLPPFSTPPRQRAPKPPPLPTPHCAAPPLRIAPRPRPPHRTASPPAPGTTPCPPGLRAPAAPGTAERAAAPPAPVRCRPPPGPPARPTAMPAPRTPERCGPPHLVPVPVPPPPPLTLHRSRRRKRRPRSRRSRESARCPPRRPAPLPATPPGTGGARGERGAREPRGVTMATAAAERGGAVRGCPRVSSPPAPAISPFRGHRDPHRGHTASAERGLHRRGGIRAERSPGYSPLPLSTPARRRYRRYRGAPVLAGQGRGRDGALGTRGCFPCPSVPVVRLSVPTRCHGTGRMPPAPRQGRRRSLDSRVPGDCPSRKADGPSTVSPGFPGTVVPVRPGLSRNSASPVLLGLSREIPSLLPLCNPGCPGTSRAIPAPFERPEPSGAVPGYPGTSLHRELWRGRAGLPPPVPVPVERVRGAAGKAGGGSGHGAGAQPPAGLIRAVTDSPGAAAPAAP
ncbi:basic proline-rich protein-like [Prinia subflava]|uniref:basic proline-rich protein-like n=1 Tax=Prinia subflava TaxID=208062 RepID=UPI002FE22E1D